jgi:sugar lactone lactonase YvrE
MFVSICKEDHLPNDPICSYQYDVDSKTQAFKNRRVFAYVDNGAADGIQVDSKGNVYAGCGDGVQVHPCLACVEIFL